LKYLTPWSRVLLEKLTVTKLVKKFPTIMEPEGLLPCSQQHTVGSCPEPLTFLWRGIIGHLISAEAGRPPLVCFPQLLIYYIHSCRGSRVRFPAGTGTFSSLPRPECLWSSPSLLSNGYRGTLSLGVKRPGREADHSHLSSAEAKVCLELYIHTPYSSSWRGA
jgi:hypothetical protein